MTLSAGHCWPTASSSSPPRPMRTPSNNRASRSSSSWRSSLTTANCSGKRKSACSGKANNTSIIITAPSPLPNPDSFIARGAVYIDTHVGIFARLDADTGALDWGYGYKTDPLQGQNRFFFFFDDYQQPEKATTSSQPLQTGEAFLIKGMQSGRLYAVDPNRMKVLWERPITKSARMLGASDSALFLGGSEISSMDLHTRQLLWATRIPNGSKEGRVLVRSDGLWQLTPRGVFEIDPKSGRVRRIFRGNDLGAAGGDLVLTDELLLAVSNRTISAYPRRGSGAGVSNRPETATIKERASK